MHADALQQSDVLVRHLALKLCLSGVGCDGRQNGLQLLEHGIRSFHGDMSRQILIVWVLSMHVVDPRLRDAWATAATHSVWSTGGQCARPVSGPWGALWGRNPAGRMHLSWTRLHFSWKSTVAMQGLNTPGTAKSTALSNSKQLILNGYFKGAGFNQQRVM
ncbi:hypothetical protein D3C78_1242930 [compost metagenome]